MDDKERAALQEKIDNHLCECGHPRKEHQKFVDGMFVGCAHANCLCSKYKPTSILDQMSEDFEKDIAETRTQYLKECAEEYDKWVDRVRKMWYGEDTGKQPIGILSDVVKEKNGNN